MSEERGLSAPWFALMVRPRHERVVAASLRTREFEEFVPFYRARRAWSDRLKELELPLFPGYVFCRFHPQHRTAILSTPGVRSIVSVGRSLAPIAGPEIEAIRRIAESSLPVEPWSYLEAGERLVIEQGPLRGLEGILLAVRGTCRLVVSIELLQRAVAVEVDCTWVRRVARLGAPVAAVRAASERLGDAPPYRGC
jgi:transcription antitermination factor NusG